MHHKIESNYRFKDCQICHILIEEKDWNQHQIQHTTELLNNKSTPKSTISKEPKEEEHDETFLAPRKFELKSELHAYLIQICPGTFLTHRFTYNLIMVQMALKSIISSRKLFDPENPTIILCDESLEKALNVKALHVSQLKDQVCQQFHPINPHQHQPTTNKIPVPKLQDLANPILPSWASNTANAVKARVQAVQPFDINGQYEISSALLKVLRTLDDVNPNQTIFSYRAVSNLLSRYLITNMKKLFDMRNIQIALVQSDALGYAFGVKAFSRSQVTSLLRYQLTLVHSSNKNNEDYSSDDSDSTIDV